MASRMTLARLARLGRRQLVMFAILSAIINGAVTAAVGAWLGQSYAAYQRKTEAVQTLADLIYERRMRARLVTSTIRRGGEVDELRDRKRSYDDAFVAWNAKVQRHIFHIRDITGEPGVTRLEIQFQELLVPALAVTDRCLTEAYDAAVKASGTAQSILDQCRMDDLHQFVLDCGASLTNELDRLTRSSLFSPFGPTDEDRRKVVARIDKYCGGMPKPIVAG